MTTLALIIPFMARSINTRVAPTLAYETILCQHVRAFRNDELHIPDTASSPRVSGCHVSRTLNRLCEACRRAGRGLDPADPLTEKWWLLLSRSV